jgi:alkylation response protein AidB-like acyl-CoA dehydrogenase
MFFNNCKVPKENEMGAIMKSAFEKGQILPVSEGYMKLLATLTPASALLTLPRAGMALMSVGIGQAAFEASVNYAKERVTFGKPIGKHQLIQNMLYEMDLLIETARLLGYKAVDAINGGDPDARRLSSMSKVYAGESAVKVAHHGGKTSTTPQFLAAVNPGLAVISIRAENPFGHLSPEVVERLVDRLG